MTDKEKLINLLENSLDDFESILFAYLRIYCDDFSATRVRSLMSRIDRDVLMPKVIQLENAVKTSSERATYLEIYLKGDMFTSEEEAKRNINNQITHAQEIKRVCERIPF
jgi:hypothetical protein